MKNLKMILAVFLCAVIVCGAMPQLAFAATSGTCGENVTWELSGTTLTIIGTGDMYDYESSGTNASPWLSNSSIKKVVIEDGVTSIGDYSFYKCSALTSASLADTLESIGSHAFASTVLSSIDIPDGVVSIGQWAFYSTDLIEMVIPDSVTDIGAYAFYYCDSLGEVTLSKNLTVINKYTFAYCKWLSFIDIPAKVGAISDYAFYGCSFMTSVFLPTKVANGGIGESAFAGCGNLKNVYFAGGEEDREAISIGSLNQCLTNATWYYYSPLAAVDEESSDISTYCTVTFDGRGVCEVEPQVVEQYDLAVEPDVDMSREGYTFLGWYNGSSKYDFSSFVTSDITLTAKWEDEEIPSYSSGGGYYYYTEAADDGIHLYRICYVGHTNSLVATASYSSVTSSVWTVPANVTYETSGVTCIATAQKAGRYTIYDTITSGYYVIAYDANNKPYNQWLGGVNICYFYLHAVEEISNITVDSGINMNVGQSVPLNYTTTPLRRICKGYKRLSLVFFQHRRCHHK
ncbi:MAG: leucine-rich repeat protein [Clostridia bacterium]|nr:leucine-rich repeat protein [Clostridia bacterium]